MNWKLNPGKSQGIAMLLINQLGQLCLANLLSTAPSGFQKAKGIWLWRRWENKSWIVVRRAQQDARSHHRLHSRALAVLLPPPLPPGHVASSFSLFVPSIWPQEDGVVPTGLRRRIFCRSHRPGGGGRPIQNESKAAGSDLN